MGRGVGEVFPGALPRAQRKGCPAVLARSAAASTDREGEVAWLGVFVAFARALGIEPDSFLFSGCVEGEAADPLRATLIWNCFGIRRPEILTSSCCANSMKAKLQDNGRRTILIWQRST